jgi:hypothetical protein
VFGNTLLYISFTFFPFFKTDFGQNLISIYQYHLAFLLAYPAGMIRKSLLIKFSFFGINTRFDKTSGNVMKPQFAASFFNFCAAPIETFSLSAINLVATG